MESNSTAYIVSAVRTPVGKAKRGSLRNVRPEEMGATVVREAINRVPGLEDAMVDDVLVGCAMPEGAQGMNMGRIVALRAGLPDSVPGATINRFCSSGLQTIALATQAISTGFADVVVAGGTESMSLVPMSGFYFQPDPGLIETEMDAYVSMGNTAENVAEKYGISRADQDRFSLRSHERATEAIQAGRFEAEIIPYQIDEAVFSGGSVQRTTRELKNDEGPRADTSLEALGKLRPVFRAGGSVTAGNSSQLSDGAAATVILSEKRLKELNVKPLARLIGFSVAGVAPGLMGIGPIEAVPKVLKQTGLELKDIGLVELNEAFASQSLAVIEELGLDESIVNVNGGAIALGHPLGCTGAKLTTTLIHEMTRRGVRYGLCTMCIGGGMGAAGVIENLNV
ncbi:MAG: acetyl-CoA C-acyltransferase [Bacteroidetes bacterium]|nr:MAG: acetyl-CoA C-acyltransferase [Bacteroidota bacterium]